MRGSKVLDARGCGVQLAEGAHAELEDNSLLRCAKAGVAARAAAQLLMVGNTVAEGRAAGVMVLQGGAGTVIRGNTIRANAKAAVQASDCAEPLIEDNQILDGLGAGLYLFGGARGRVLRNLIRGCAGAGMRLEEAAPHLAHNTVCSGGDVGILVHGLAPSPPPSADTSSGETASPAPAAGTGADASAAAAAAEAVDAASGVGAKAMAAVATPTAASRPLACEGLQMAAADRMEVAFAASRADVNPEEFNPSLMNPEGFTPPCIRRDQPHASGGIHPQ
jgi:hypothetical protein